MDGQSNSEPPPGKWRGIPDHWDEDPSEQFQFLGAEVLRHVDSPSADSRLFIAAAMNAIRGLPRDWCSAERAETLLAITRFYWMDGNVSDSLDAASAAVAVATQGSHRLVEAQARNAWAIQLWESYDYVASLREMLKALEISRELGNSALEAKFYNNLGGFYSRAGLIEEAFEFYQRSARFFEKTSDRTSTWNALENAAGACLGAGQIERAALLAREADAYRPEIAKTAKEQQWVAQSALLNCLLLIETGHIEKAAAIAKLAKGVAEVSGLEAARVRAEICEAITTYLTEGAGSNAIADVIDRTRGLSHLHVLTLDAAVRAYEAAGESDRALAVERELLAFAKIEKYETIRQTLGRSSDWETLRPAKAANLEATVCRTVNELINTAITQSVRAGYDDSRIFRISRLTELFAMSEGWSQDRVQKIALASKLIDLGTMVVSSELLNKRRELLSGEQVLVAEHARFGSELLVNARLALLEQCVPVVRFHHERWDGTGPSALKRDAIPLEARVVALCDSFDALTHERPWRNALSIETALRIIGEETGTHFDPGLSNRFIAWVETEFWSTDDFDSYLAVEALENDYVQTRKRIEQLAGAGSRGLF